MKLWMILSLIGMSLTACKSMQRSHEHSTQAGRTGALYMTPQEVKDQEISRYEFGYNNYTRALSELEHNRLQQRVFLKQLERNLISTMDKDLYYRNKPFFRNDAERIDFLNIQDFSDKLKWLRQNNFDSRISNYSDDEREAIEQNDILLHMSMNAVKESWGEPDNREISGNEMHGNQKWTYFNYQSSPEGYQKQNRTLFFENGRVVAWQTK